MNNAPYFKCPLVSEEEMNKIFKQIFDLPMCKNCISIQFEEKYLGSYIKHGQQYFQLKIPHGDHLLLLWLIGK
jgi:hypothetical protein